MSYIINQDVPVGSALTQLDALSDVNISNPQDGDVLSYNGTTGKWVQNSNMIAMYDGTNYTSLVATIQPNSYYEAPEDGLYYFYLGSGSTSPAGLFVSSTIGSTTMIAQVNSGTGACIVPIPLKKGTKVYTRSEGTSTYSVICRIG